ncbi:MAG: hypothetical protein EXX96DRAFT_611397 [Benjaminiella poitrasii]|nr:MAG: hypothetical protein EXX96DRAFT_611397 [Benjaminiella poitrasii]
MNKAGNEKGSSLQNIDKCCHLKICNLFFLGQEQNPFEESFSSIVEIATAANNCHSNDRYEQVLFINDVDNKNNSRLARNRKRDRTVTNNKVKDDCEKRKNFLERNRIAALRCRQRKKQWLSNLQARMEFLSRDNDKLEMEADALHKEILELKTLLIAHRHCSTI